MSHKDANHGHLRLMLMRSRKEIVDYESWAGILSPNRKLPTQLNLLISSWLVRVTRIYLRQSGLGIGGIKQKSGGTGYVVTNCHLCDD